MEYITDRMSLFNGDCVQVIEQIPDNSIHFNIFSPPFANLYIYSDDLADMGNCKNIDEFFKQFDYLIPQLWRVTIPGRLCAVHCKQLPKYKGRDGQSGLIDFRGEIIKHFESFGWQYHSEVCIWTDPVMEMQKTKPQGLLYCQLQRDASFTRQGMPEYLVIFRKWDAKNEDLAQPVRHYKNEQDLLEKTGGEITQFNQSQIMDLDIWQRYASPVWFDIRRTDVLNGKIARDDEDEKHICPLQLEVIRRAIKLWTNPNDIVFTPFLGVGSESYVALEQGRRAVGIELKPSYWGQAVEYCKSIANNDQMSLF